VPSDLLPLFPLNTVLFPGVAIPLHVFEYRYRQLFDELSAQPGPKRFGVVAIRQGLEVGEDEVPVLHGVGCVAEVRRADRFPDGRYDVVAVGGPRFRLVEVDDGMPYLRGVVEYLPEPTDPSAEPLARKGAEAFVEYLLAVANVRDEELTDPPVLPVDDPVLLSYLMASAMRLDLPEKQSLLAIPDAPARLRAVLSVLRRETKLIAAAPAEVPTEGPFSLN
jgi:hypothetical protein